GYTSCIHARCHAHLLRELEAARELTGQAWPHRLQRLLSGAHQRVESAEAQGRSALPTHERDELRQEYTALNAGREPSIPSRPSLPPGRRGRPKKTKVQNLLERPSKRPADALRLVEDSRVPFTNNQAGQDLRMAKVKQKLSGSFRTPIGAQRFYRLRSYVSTARKWAFRPIEALRGLLVVNPSSPSRRGALSASTIP
ncbi:MAG TPA: IS66 family transposase, partial [Clostridiales bacterium UBA8153]|nr:IS66 family transposase [Clostridiales bacterium UBA8153]